MNEVRLPWYKLWYQYNKQKIPMIFILIGTVFFTGFLDFEIQTTDIKLESHIAAIRKFLDTPYNNLSAFYLFLMYLIAIIQVFNSASFAKTRSKIIMFLMTGLTVIQTLAVGLYTSIFFREQASRADYTIDSIARLSFTVFIIGASFFIVGTIFSWIYVNWKYVKQKE